ncbi:TRAP transporter small permease subunit [Petroclostridium sp. X23]|uniref:TRAP transporter small permease n=1 Tax=Petroclostridium sp. X23 TaxID=3045146 RepID=UPI0024AE583F|nr:TRAP transporter small permease subunit [Petroclostridium sp. X23]WHH56935.1 TRAP transporter small permease subunit [Petroclostridium sp. X23]
MVFKNFEEIISGTALVIVLAIVIFNVFMRYIFSISFNWAEEIATMGFVWTVFLGTSACYKRGMHIGIDIIIHFILNSLERLMELGTGILLIVANAYLTYLSWVFSIAAWVSPRQHF